MQGKLFKWKCLHKLLIIQRKNNFCRNYIFSACLKISFEIFCFDEISVKKTKVLKCNFHRILYSEFYSMLRQFCILRSPKPRTIGSFSKYIHNTVFFFFGNFSLKMFTEKFLKKLEFFPKKKKIYIHISKNSIYHSLFWLVERRITVNIILRRYLPHSMQFNCTTKYLFVVILGISLRLTLFIY